MKLCSLVHSFFFRYTGHTNDSFMLECDFTHDDAYVLSGSTDGTVLFWDLVEVPLTFNLVCHSIG